MHIPTGDPYSWSSRTILVPRFGLLISGGGSRFRLILPGRYFVRRSRTTGRLVYRQAKGF
jgi:hypothetical protein